MSRRRQLDGTFRGPKQFSKLSWRTLHARWFEEEVLKLKILGVTTFNAIAAQITKVGRGEAQAVVAFPPGMEFPKDYSISAVACWRACQRALLRGPRLKAQEMRQLDTDRLEEAILASQKGVKQGDPQAVQNLARLIVVRARLNGYMMASKMEVSGKVGGPVEVKQVDDSESERMLERLTQEEQIEFLRLYNKARGFSNNNEVGGEGGCGDQDQKNRDEQQREENVKDRVVTPDEAGSQGADS